MLDQPVIYELRDEVVQSMEAPELICFIATASAFIALDPLLSRDLPEAAKKVSIERVMAVAHLVRVAKESLHKYF